MLAHPQEYDATSSLGGSERLELTADELRDRCSLRAKVKLTSVENMERFSHLSEVLSSNGENLLHNLDTEEPLAPKIEAPTPIPNNPAVFQNKAAPVQTAAATPRPVEPLFKCGNCSYTSRDPRVLKEHVRVTHGDDPWLSMVDARSLLRTVYYHCYNTDCRFFSTSKDLLCSHYDFNRAHGPPYINFRRLAEIDKDLSKKTSLLGGAKPAAAEALTTNSAHTRHKSKESSKLKGFVKYNMRLHPQALLYTGDSNVFLCRYCPDFWSVGTTELIEHQLSAHSNAYPCAVSVKHIAQKRRAEMYLCPHSGCNLRDQSCLVVYEHVLKNHNPSNKYEFMREPPGVVNVGDVAAPAKKSKTQSGDTLASSNLVKAVDVSGHFLDESSQSNGSSDALVSTPVASQSGPSGKVSSGRLSKTKAAFKIAQAIESSGELTGRAKNILSVVKHNPASPVPSPSPRSTSPTARRRSKPQMRLKQCLRPLGGPTPEEVALAAEIEQSFDISEPNRLFLASGRWKESIDAVLDTPASRARDRYMCAYCQMPFATLETFKAHCLTHHPLEEEETMICVIDKSKLRLRKRTRIYLCPESLCPFYCKEEEDMVAHACGKPFDQQPFFVGASDAAQAPVASPAPAAEVKVKDESEDARATPVLEAALTEGRESNEDSNSQPPVLDKQTTAAKSECDEAESVQGFAALRKRILDEMASDSDEESSAEESKQNMETDEASSQGAPELEKQLSNGSSASDESQEAAASESDSEVKTEEPALVDNKALNDCSE